ncbi:hypothetical protein SAMN05444156_2987 [Verrucomicrobium sp. GAS474]|uniref:hypothetical protein n=1 Tax=Verrucomicrobium sp. GAS474 TaxID=1882831 RepID=UPI00087AB63B|nr:hypothetical protein [Verrucomicrobium sp. GAS474]SDU27254.1 hypothetical protein SAMN05444156_2987 [Verrucomicrobium sp. GAS474]
MISEIEFKGWKRNLRLNDGIAELVITLDVGPRILHAAPIGGKNLFCEFPDQIGRAGEEEWKIRGGHRFWTAPENEESYTPDNVPVDYRKIDDNTVEIASPAQSDHGWQKTLRIASLGNGRFTVLHTLTNSGTKPLEVTPWALSVMAPGGTAVLPQSAPKLHPLDNPPGTPVNVDDYQSNRRVVLWKYSHLNDPRLTLEKEFWFVRHEADSKCFKMGLHFQEKWVAYQLGNHYFAKTVPAPGGTYPDDGSNFELFTNKDILELETLAPLGPLPVGASRSHEETWQIGTLSESITTVAGAKAFFATLK